MTHWKRTPVSFLLPFRCEDLISSHDKLNEDTVYKGVTSDGPGIQERLVPSLTSVVGGEVFVGGLARLPQEPSSNGRLTKR